MMQAHKLQQALGLTLFDKIYYYYYLFFQMQQILDALICTPKDSSKYWA